MEVVAGAHDLDSGGVRVLNQCGKVCACGEELNINEVSAIGIQNRAEKTEVSLMADRYAAALFLRAQGHKQQLLL